MTILKEREKTHGDYATNAFTAQTLKNIISDAPSYSKLSPVQRESLDLICTKIARIVCGDPNEPDHYRDIAGYADLVVFNLKDKNTASRATPTKETQDEPNVTYEFPRCMRCGAYEHVGDCYTGTARGFNGFVVDTVWSR